MNFYVYLESKNAPLKILEKSSGKTGHLIKNFAKKRNILCSSHNVHQDNAWQGIK